MCTFTSSFLERGLEREGERVSGGERELCATMLLGQANVVRHCALAKACFALAFDSQVQCRECPLNVGPLLLCLLLLLLLLYCFSIWCIYLLFTIYLWLESWLLSYFGEKKEFFMDWHWQALSNPRSLSLLVVHYFKTIYCSGKPSMTRKNP